ncbi:hypothetical protein P152DRAFT_510789 [Eremomyces bilateralis CBS 781.70]|uniref:Alpha/beta-hydrolase n=1 Tax=Eremomyces bilateralis CBS 781.70 TaxID=1392243 RepID=A0A6G1GI79_9PEZI|nr:uncharacterized protein P152DRAFT_510789 [Eremomyces bilateralis CBS 781.70]KAF1817589.1 hypothetical protein P152DRAFT_510789 [Eremomyces bilateralis CBS 781.70]
MTLLLMRSIEIAALAVSALLSGTSASPLQQRNNGPMVYGFDEIQPSPELIWTSCFDNFTCAMLEVPLDYTDPSIGSTNVAFIKKPSSNTTAIDLFAQPGGPGGSGVSTILEWAETFPHNGLGSQYHLIGFDPRGVNRSGIELECFPGNPAAKLRFSQDVLDRPVDDSSRGSLYQAWELSRGWGERCTAVQDPKLPKKYANTVAVANDVLRFTELNAKNLGHPPEEAKVWFYGRSYGTVLGATIAALFPDRIGRMILDGVVDADDYYGGGWATAVADADQSARTFFTSCYEAGPELCAFYGNASSAEDIELRVFNIFDDLREYPILISDPLMSSTPLLVGVSELKAFFFNALYNAVQNFPALALVLDELEHRNATTLSIAGGRVALGIPMNTTDDTYTPGFARTHIACIDANGRYNLSTFEEYQRHVEFQVNLSFFGGNTMASIVTTPCRGFGIQPPESQVMNIPVSSDHTNVPILFVGNTNDPVTPLRSAQRMSSQFAGSGVLTVDGTGHTSRGAPSKCTADHYAAYLASGTLPPPDTVCKGDLIPFVDRAGAGGGAGPIETV